MEQLRFGQLEAFPADQGDERTKSPPAGESGGREPGIGAARAKCYVGTEQRQRTASPPFVSDTAPVWLLPAMSSTEEEEEDVALGPSSKL